MRLPSDPPALGAPAPVRVARVRSNSPDAPPRAPPRASDAPLTTPPPPPPPLLTLARSQARARRLHAHEDRQATPAPRASDVRLPPPPGKRRSVREPRVVRPSRIAARSIAPIAHDDRPPRASPSRPLSDPPPLAAPPPPPDPQARASPRAQRAPRAAARGRARPRPERRRRRRRRVRVRRSVRIARGGSLPAAKANPPGGTRVRARVLPCAHARGPAPRRPRAHGDGQGRLPLAAPRRRSVTERGARRRRRFRRRRDLGETALVRRGLHRGAREGSKGHHDSQQDVRHGGEER